MNSKFSNFQNFKLVVFAATLACASVNGAIFPTRFDTTPDGTLINGNVLTNLNLGSAGLLNMTTQTGLHDSTAASNAQASAVGQAGFWYDATPNQWNLFAARTTATNWDSWNLGFNIPGGVITIGSMTNMNRFNSGSSTWYIDGNTNLQTIARQGADEVLTIAGANPWGSGGGFNAAWVTTNSVGNGIISNTLALEMVVCPSASLTNNLPDVGQLSMVGNLPFSINHTFSLGGVTANYSSLYLDVVGNDVIERHPQMISGKLKPNQTGWLDGYAYDPVPNTFTNNATQYWNGSTINMGSGVNMIATTGQLTIHNAGVTIDSTLRYSGGTLLLNNAGTPGSPMALFPNNDYLNVDSSGNMALGIFSAGTVADYALVVTNTRAAVYINTNLIDPASITGKGFNSTTAHTPASVTVGASPFTFTSVNPTALECYITGSVAYSVAKNGVSIYGSLAGDAYVLLQTNSSLTITYTVAPTMTTNSW